MRAECLKYLGCFFCCKVVSYICSKIHSKLYIHIFLILFRRRIENIINENHENKGISKEEYKKNDEYEQAYDCVVQHQNIIELS